MLAIMTTMPAARSGPELAGIKSPRQTVVRWKQWLLAVLVGWLLLPSAVASGEALAWGWNNFGQTNVPASVLPVSVAANVDRHFVLMNTGSLICVGPDFVGEATVPVGLNNVVAVAVGYYHNLALKSDGTLAVWGDYSWDVPSGLSNVVAVAAGSHHCMALKSDGTVVAWGSDAYGQTNVPPGLSDVIGISAGGSHSIALKSDGTVVAWGLNSSGQCTVPFGLNDVVAIAGGYAHTLALKSNGTVAAWGSNSNGQTDVPPGLSNVTAIASSSYGFHNLALKNDATVVAWGKNIIGEATVPAGLNNVISIATAWGYSVVLKGDGTLQTFSSNIPAPASPAQAGASSGIVAVSGGNAFSLALRYDGTVVGWGDNTYGQAAAPLSLTNAVAISAGGAHSLALRTNGTVAAWGSSGQGRTNVPAGLSNVVAVAAGGAHSLALKNDGTIIGWGWNAFGQTTPPPGLSNVTAIAGGYAHSVALKNNGTVTAWGWNVFGATTVPPGLNNVIAIEAGENHCLALKSNGTVVAWGNQSNVPPDLNSVIAIAAGNGFSLALKSNQTVVAWGDNSMGQLTLASNLNNILAIGAGFAHGLAVRELLLTLPPDNFFMSNTSVQENQPAATSVGAFKVYDPNPGDIHTFDLVAGFGDTDNASFFIDGDVLKTAKAFDYRARDTYQVRVRATDPEELFIERNFEIRVASVVPPAPFEMRAPRFLPDGSMQLNLLVEEGRRYTLQISSDLANWFDTQRLTADGPNVQFTEPDAPPSPRRFYRLKAD
jgi:alpha-tubulin suppressor-like RCC1 family protein